MQSTTIIVIRCLDAHTAGYSEARGNERAILQTMGIFDLSKNFKLTQSFSKTDRVLSCYILYHASAASEILHKLNISTSIEFSIHISISPGWKLQYECAYSNQVIEKCLSRNTRNESFGSCTLIFYNR
jgi:hypothetical protein